MMLDFVVTMLLTIVIAMLLWHAGDRWTEAKAFWRLLAIGWAVNLPGNIAWGAYEMITGKGLPILSFVDAIYTIRYILVLIALHRYPGQSNRRWPGLLAALSTATALIWTLLYRPTLLAAEITLPRVRDFIGVAMYPVMDTVLLYAGVLTWAHAAKNRLRNSLGILILALASYSAANWFQFGDLAVAGFISTAPDIFWPLSDILVGLAATYALWNTKPQEPTTTRTPKTSWSTKAPYVGCALTIGTTLLDFILQQGRIDPVLVTCSVLAAGAAAGRYWLGGNSPPQRDRAP
jgi:hypothetical protein